MAGRAKIWREIEKNCGVKALVEKAPNLNIHIYKHNFYTRTITDTFNYLKSNLDMLKFDIGRHIFKENAPVFSKEKTE